MSILEQTNKIRGAFQRLRAAQTIYNNARVNYLKAKPKCLNPSVEVEHHFLKATWALEAALCKLAQAESEWRSIRNPTLH